MKCPTCPTCKLKLPLKFCVRASLLGSISACPECNARFRVNEAKNFKGGMFEMLPMVGVMPPIAYAFVYLGPEQGLWVETVILSVAGMLALFVALAIVMYQWLEFEPAPEQDQHQTQTSTSAKLTQTQQPEPELRL